MNDGRNSDGAIFVLLRPEHCLEMQRLALLDPAHLPSDDSSELFTHQIAGDEASHFLSGKQTVSATRFLVVGREQCEPLGCFLLS
jgi:hypothetical protein